MKQHVYYNLWYMSCEWKGHTTNDLKTSLHVIIKGNRNSKSKGFLKHDHFVCELAQSTFLIKKQHFGIQRFKTIKREKYQNEVTCILPCFDSCAQFSRLEACNNSNLHPFLSFFPQLFRPYNTFLQICFDKFNGNIFQALKNFFFSNCILTNIRNGMFKASPLKVFHHI
jgi:hypothetical protein